MSSDPPPLYTAAPRESTPNYVAADGGEDINLEEYTGTFYAVITDDWQGFAISKSIFISLKTRYPRATTWSAEGWSSFKTRWYSTPPSSPFPSTILSISRSPSVTASISVSSSPASSISPSPSPSPLLSPAPSTVELSASPSPATERTIVYRGTFPAWLARTSAVVYEYQQVLTAYAREYGGVRPELLNQLPPEHRRVVEAYAYPTDPPPPTPPPFHSAAHNRLCQEDVLNAAEYILPFRADAYEGFMFAVQGHPRIFLDGDSTITLLKLTPQGELFFSRDEREVWAFLEETARNV
ncbi:hypothetical protein C8F04DRAFT_1203151 [Mycena alexandri]|uniref:Uncharacterized protein n=1 Tax=Mycena alexandri TaxID=1745969 RepID=A0AAD6WM01_9AGAR|nr:hypothetical protein C8F04DRAFT_1203151 [Mycena alexandri]